MKNLAPIIVSVLLIVLVGCDSDNKFIGTWKANNGMRVIFIEISLDEENKEMFNVKVIQGETHPFLYDKERDVLYSPLQSHYISEIAIDENSSHLLWENLKWTKVK